MTGALPIAGAQARMTPRAVLALGVALLAIGVVAKLVIRAGGPLWLDEGWTLAIVGRPGWGAFVEQLRMDVNPPLYFLLLRAWTSVAGVSDAALRAPSTLFAGLAPFVILFSRLPLPRSDRWAWAMVLGLLPLPIYFAQEARGYALLLLLETGAAVAFLRVLDRPSLPRAALWCGATTLALLTHHHALLVAGAQGLIYLAVHRERALRTWPAALVFLPWLGWMSLQAPRVAEFARPEYAWYARLTLADLPGLAAPLIGGAGVLWLALLGGGRLAESRLAERGVSGEQASRAALLTGLASLMALAVLVGLGLLKPSFSPRYLTPAVPGLALGLVVALRAAGARAAPVTQALLASVLAAGVIAGVLRGSETNRRDYEMETASADLMRAGAERLIFLWDNPTNGVLKPAERDALADAFFVRAARPVAVEGVRLAPGEDPNARLAAALAAHPRSALLWLWDEGVPATAAAAHPPRLPALDPAIRCRRYGERGIGVLACVRGRAFAPT